MLFGTRNTQEYSTGLRGTQQTVLHSSTCAAACRSPTVASAPSTAPFVLPSAIGSAPVQLAPAATAAVDAECHALARGTSVWTSRPRAARPKEDVTEPTEPIGACGKKRADAELNRKHTQEIAVFVDISGNPA